MASAAGPSLGLADAVSLRGVQSPTGKGDPVQNGEWVSGARPGAPISHCATVRRWRSTDVGPSSWAATNSRLLPLVETSSQAARVREHHASETRLRFGGTLWVDLVAGGRLGSTRLFFGLGSRRRTTEGFVAPVTKRRARRSPKLLTHTSFCGGEDLIPGEVDGDSQARGPSVFGCAKAWSSTTGSPRRAEGEG